MLITPKHSPIPASTIITQWLGILQTSAFAERFTRLENTMERPKPVSDLLCSNFLLTTKGRRGKVKEEIQTMTIC